VSKIVVLCEGRTEELAIEHFIARQWNADGFGSVGLGHRNLKGSFNKVGPFACNSLDRRDVLAVFTLVDLYKMNRVIQPSDDELDVKVDRVQSWLRTQVQGHRRAHNFFPHVSVHEVEAWVLAEGEALSQRLQDPSIRPDPQAELKDFQKPPKKRIDELFRRTNKTRYRESLDGQPLFSKMSFQPVYDSCQCFRKFYDDLKAAARPSFPLTNAPT
jgi:hypothetical protein